MVSVISGFNSTERHSKVTLGLHIHMQTHIHMHAYYVHTDIKKLYRVCSLRPEIVNENSWKEVVSAEIDWLIRAEVHLREWNTADPEASRLI